MNTKPSLQPGDDGYLEATDETGVHLTTRPYLEKVLAHTDAYEVAVFGQPIVVLPGVMSPKYDWAGVYLIDYLPKDFSGQDVLEIGPGSGLVSTFVGLRGAKSVTAADINPAAVENTTLNFEKARLQNARVLHSNVFQALQESDAFDSMIFNLPYHDGKVENDLERGVIDEGYQAMQAFLAGAKQHLKQGGKLYVGFSRSGNVEKFLQEIEKNGFQIEHFDEKNSWGDPAYSGPDFEYNCQVYTLTCKQ